MNQDSNSFMPNYWMNRTSILLLLLHLGGCGAFIGDRPGAPLTQQPWHWSETQEPYPLFTAMALESKEVSLPHLHPADIEGYCQDYVKLSRLQRLRFWADLVSAISFHESGHNPELKYTERFRDNNGARVISRGLLQLSLESSIGYGCPLQEAAQLHDPARNIDCAVRILNHWVQQDGVISQDVGWLQSQWRGGARYWSVLRQPVKRSAIQAQLQRQPYCNT